MTTGTKIQVRLIAKHSYGTRNNAVQTKEVEFSNESWFTFKGGKTEYRICGNQIYSITGPERFYEVIK